MCGLACLVMLEVPELTNLKYFLNGRLNLLHVDKDSILVEFVQVVSTNHVFVWCVTFDDLMIYLLGFSLMFPHKMISDHLNDETTYKMV